MAKVKTGPKTRRKLGGPRIGDGGPRSDKAAAVAEFKRRLEAGPIVLTEYRGLTVTELAELRRTLQGSADYKIVKNTLATIAAREVGVDALVALLEGPTAFAFVTGDVAKVAKDLADFAKRAPALTLKGAYFEGRVLSSDQTKTLATLESREVMLARIASMSITPIQQTVNVFAAGLNKLGAVLAQYRDKLAADAA